MTTLLGTLLRADIINFWAFHHIVLAPNWSSSHADRSPNTVYCLLYCVYCLLSTFFYLQSQVIYVLFNVYTVNRILSANEFCPFTFNSMLTVVNLLSITLTLVWQFVATLHLHLLLLLHLHLHLHIHFHLIYIFIYIYIYIFIFIFIFILFLIFIFIFILFLIFIFIFIFVTLLLCGDNLSHYGTINDGPSFEGKYINIQEKLSKPAINLRHYDEIYWWRYDIFNRRHCKLVHQSQSQNSAIFTSNIWSILWKTNILFFPLNT